MEMSLCGRAQFVEHVLGEEAGASGGRLPQGHQAPRAASGPQATRQALQGAALGAAARLGVPAPCRQRRADRGDQRVTARLRALRGGIARRRVGGSGQGGSGPRPSPRAPSPPQRGGRARSAEHRRPGGGRRAHARTGYGEPDRVQPWRARRGAEGRSPWRRCQPSRWPRFRAGGHRSWRRRRRPSGGASRGIYCPSLGDAMGLCLSIAHVTKTIPFGTSVQPIYLQHPAQLAGQASYIHEISGGPLPPGHRRQPRPGPATARRQRRQAAVGHPRLRRRAAQGESASGPLPPITLATLRDKMVDLSVEISDGAVWANASRNDMPRSVARIPRTARPAAAPTGRIGRRSSWAT